VSIKVPTGKFAYGDRLIGKKLYRRKGKKSQAKRKYRCVVSLQSGDGIHTFTDISPSKYLSPNHPDLLRIYINAGLDPDKCAILFFHER
jgi:hypothetical protein